MRGDYGCCDVAYLASRLLMATAEGLERPRHQTDESKSSCTYGCYNDGGRKTCETPPCPSWKVHARGFRHALRPERVDDPGQRSTHKDQGREEQPRHVLSGRVVWGA